MFLTELSEPDSVRVARVPASFSGTCAHSGFLLAQVSALSPVPRVCRQLLDDIHWLSRSTERSPTENQELTDAMLQVLEELLRGKLISIPFKPSKCRFLLPFKSGKCEFCVHVHICSYVTGEIKNHFQ